HGVPGVESEQLPAPGAAVECPASAGNGELQDGRLRPALEQPFHAAALRCAEELRKRRRLAAGAKPEQERDRARHLPVVVEPAGGLESGHFRRAIEGDGARPLLADQRRKDAARGLFRAGVVAGPRVEQHAVHVEDHAADALERQAHGASSARSAARKASLAAGAPMLTRRQRFRSRPAETLRIRTPRRKRPACSSAAGLRSCSKRRKFAPEAWTKMRSSRRAAAIRARSCWTRRTRSCTS